MPKKSVYKTAEKNQTARQKANWHAKQVLKELKKKRTNWKAVKYHKTQMRKHRKWGVFTIKWKK